MTITTDHILHLERRHDALWICLNLLGDVVLYLYRPDSVCCSVLACYLNYEWFDPANRRISRDQVKEIINGCIGGRARSQERAGPLTNKRRRISIVIE